MEADRIESSSPRGVESSHPSRTGWSLAVLIVLSLLLFRIFYLAFLSSWELVGDEAHYWEWSRRPDLSYYTKGPGIAWVIGISTRLFGDSAAAVRLPAAIASAVMLLFGARLAFNATARDGRAAWCTALTLGLAPGYVASAQLATTDVFYSAAWMAAAFFVWLAVRPSNDRSRLRFWIAAGAAIGVGCLFKYTALLELLGIAAFLFVQRRRIAIDRRIIVGISSMLVMLVVVSSPMILWNARHGWPTIAHQIGRLRLPGGDESVSLAWSPMWFPTFAGAQLALLGVIGALLIFMAVRRSRDLQDATPEDPLSLARSLLLWLAVPILVFYFGLSLFREAQGNWAIAAYSTLLVLVGIDASRTLAARPRPAFQSWWHWYLGVGVVAGVVILMGPSITRLPGLSSMHAMQRIQQRVSGASVRAALVDRIASRVNADTGRPPFVIAKGYQDASLLAFYLPRRPIVCCAASAFGSRPNAYDYFSDTKLDDPQRFGLDAVLVGAGADRWRAALRFDSIEELDAATPIFIARNYHGPVHAEAPR